MRNRFYAKILKGVALASSLFFIGGVSAQESASFRPNIVLFNVDDLGWLDSSVSFGAEVYPANMRVTTPSLQRLADKGVLLTNAYSSPSATATQASVQSGMHPAHMRLGMSVNAQRNTPSDYEGDMSRPVWNMNGLSVVPGIDGTQQITPLAAQLRKAGYFTIHAGRKNWSSTGVPGVSSSNLGYLVSFGENLSGVPVSYAASENFGNKAGVDPAMYISGLEEYNGSDMTLTQVLTDKALKALEYPVEHKEPFFLDISQYGVERPIHAVAQAVQKYKDRGMSQSEAEYCSMVEGVDESLGMILSWLDNKKIADNTVIIFYSNVGGDTQDGIKGDSTSTFNAPLRAGKGSVYEGGVRVPMVVYWPGKTAAGMRLNTPVTTHDLYPTICDIAGVKGSESVQPIDGQSLTKLLSDGSQLAAKAVINGRIRSQKEANSFMIPQAVSGLDPERTVVSHMPHQQRAAADAERDYMSAIRQGDWKLIYRMKDGKFELYNLAEDLGEQNNLAAQHPDLVKRMANELAGRLREWGAPMPRRKGSGTTVALPDETAVAPMAPLTPATSVANSDSN